MIDIKGSAPRPAALRTESSFGQAAGSGPPITVQTLDNGLDLVVVPDRRAAVVTHMVW